MKNFLSVKSISGLVIAAMVLASCTQSSNVVSSKLIQKRKYNKGIFVRSNSNSTDLAKKESENNDKEVKIERVVVSEQVPITAISASKNESTPIVNIINEAKETTTPIKAAIASKIISKKIEKIIEKANNAELKSASKADKKKESKSNRAGSDQVLALILAIIVGGIGIHRFYLGYTWQGVVQLLTFGACGVWILIDIIRIITGDLGPKSGGYSNKL